MRTTFEKMDVTVTTKKNALPTSKAVHGRFHLSADFEKASFVEEEGEAVIFGERKSRRVFRGRNCSVHYNPEEDKYIIRVQVLANKRSLDAAEWDCEECLGFIGRKLKERLYGT